MSAEHTARNVMIRARAPRPAGRPRRPPRHGRRTTSCAPCGGRRERPSGCSARRRLRRVLRLQRIVGACSSSACWSARAWRSRSRSRSSRSRRASSAPTSRSARAFSPGCDCDAATRRFSLDLSGAADLSVRVTTRRGRLVRQLLDHEQLERRRAADVGRHGRRRAPQVTDRSYQVQVRFARGRWRAAPNARDPRRHAAAGHHGRAARRPDDRLRRGRRRRRLPLHRRAATSPAGARGRRCSGVADGTVDEVWRPGRAGRARRRHRRPS